MANHVIYDSLWESDKLAQCSREASLAYPWIFLVADDHGRFEYKARMVWKHAFSYRTDVTVEDVALWLDEYWRVGLLVRYHLDGDLAYWYKFRGRKPSDRKKSDYADPEGLPVLTYSAATPPPPPRHVAATPPPRGGENPAPEIDQIRSRSEVDQIGKQAVPPVPPATTKKSNPPTWLTPYAEDWWERWGRESEPPFGEMASAFSKPLRELDRDDFRRRWVRFLAAAKTSQLARPVRFVQGLGEWADKGGSKSENHGALFQNKSKAEVQAEAKAAMEREATRR